MARSGCGRRDGPFVVDSLVAPAGPDGGARFEPGCGRVGAVGSVQSGRYGDCSMDAITVLFASAAVLLVIAGVVKVTGPSATAATMRDLGVKPIGPLDANRLTVLLGSIEIVVGVGALVADVAAVAAAVGLLYVVFAATVARALRVGVGSCGCFGRIDAPPSWWHVIGNLGLAAASFLAAAGRTPLEVMESQPAGGIGFVLAVGVLAGVELVMFCLLYTSPSPRDRTRSRMPSSA